jgi:uncharacterized membrane protein YciS (DUF1049 family)
MGFEDYISNNAASEYLIGSVGAGFLALGIALVILIVAAIYIYTALAWSSIATKLKYKRPWLAWIPFANTAMMLQLGKFHWAWIFLILIPVAGWLALLVLLIIATWRIFEKRKYPGWLSLSLIIPQIGGVLYLIVIGFVAWSDRKSSKLF